MFTGLGLHSCVNPFMCLKGIRMNKGIPAFLTYIGFSSLVNLLMPLEGSGRNEHFPTLLIQRETVLSL
jgi:hypothetical protein